MMDYFEVKDRLDNLQEFRKLYREYASFTNHDGNVPAQMVRERLEPMVPLAVDSLNRANLGGMITREAPTLGGKKVKVNLIRAIFRDKVMKRFRVDPREPLGALDKGVMVYQSKLWKRRIQLFNPLFWLHNFIAYLAQHPLLILRRAGFDVVEAEKSPIIRIYMALFQAAVYFLILKWLGVINWLWFDILGH